VSGVCVCLCVCVSQCLVCVCVCARVRAREYVLFVTVCISMRVLGCVIHKLTPLIKFIAVFVPRYTQLFLTVVLSLADRLCPLCLSMLSLCDTSEVLCNVTD